MQRIDRDGRGGSWPPTPNKGNNGVGKEEEEDNRANGQNIPNELTLVVVFPYFMRSIIKMFSNIFNSIGREYTSAYKTLYCK